MAPATGNGAAAQASRPQDQGTGTPRPLLLLLPLELRLLCYEFAFSYPSSSLERPSNRLSLLLTCAQIYAEAKLLAYSLTAFNIPFTLVSELPSRLRRLRYDQVRSIRSLSISIDPWAWLVVEKTHEYFLPRLDPDGLARLHLDRLHLRVTRDADHVCGQFFLRAFSMWHERYFATRRAWMDTVSAERNKVESFRDLVAQWLQMVNADVVLVTEEGPVQPYVVDMSKLVGNASSRYSQWQRKTDSSGEFILETNRLEHIHHAR